MAHSLLFLSKRDCVSFFTCTEPFPRYPLTKQDVFHEAKDFLLGLFDKRNKDLRGPQCQITSSWCPNRILFFGNKLMYIEVGKVLDLQFIDSLKFLQMKLAAIPKAFGLQQMKTMHAR